MVAWFAFPLGGVLWVASRYNRVGFLIDDWAQIDRAVSSESWFTGGGMLTPYRGHLFAVPHLAYRLQVEVAGAQSTWLIFTAFCISLAALQLGIAAVLWRLGVPTILALLLATMVTYFGPGAEQMAVILLWSAALSLAACFFAAFIALRTNVGLGTAVSTAALLLFAFITFSSLVFAGVVLVGVIVAFTWPGRLTLVALTPPAVLMVLWIGLDQGTTETATWSQSFSLGWEILARAAGGLVGGTQLAGAIALPLALALVVLGLARHSLPPRVIVTFVGGLLAAMLMVVAITVGKGLHARLEPLSGHRYVAWVAVFLVVAFAPALTSVVRTELPRHAASAVAVVAAMLTVVVFTTNTNALLPIRQFNESWAANIEMVVRGSVGVLAEGCPTGTRPDPGGHPARAAGGHIFYRELPVRLFQELMSTGALTPEYGIPTTRAVEREICPPPRAAQPAGAEVTDGAG